VVLLVWAVRLLDVDYDVVAVAVLGFAGNWLGIVERMLQMDYSQADVVDLHWC